MVTLGIALPTALASCTLLGVDRCWESGGPDWLFLSALLGFGIGVTFAVLAWSAWTRPRVRPKPSRVSILIGGALLAWCTFVFLESRPDVGEVAITVIASAVTLAMFVVVERAHRVSLAGVRLEGGMSAAFGVVRWSSLLNALVASAVGVWSVVAMVAMGHSCISP
jgi:hypothetical protein